MSLGGGRDSDRDKWGMCWHRKNHQPSCTRRCCVRELCVKGVAADLEDGADLCPVKVILNDPKGWLGNGGVGRCTVSRIELKRTWLGAVEKR